MWRWQKVPSGCLQEKIIFDGYRQMKEHLGHRGFRLDCNIHATMMTNHWILGYYIFKQIHLCTFMLCLAEDWVVYSDIFAFGTSHSCVQTGRPRSQNNQRMWRIGSLRLQWLKDHDWQRLCLGIGDLKLNFPMEYYLSEYPYLYMSCNAYPDVYM